ncbi:cytochrome P450 2J5-like [Protopterus annectens]|uniref:cytochrome P450 2J5-like n=1 Tax=Protopterus annectens TaxID=7888 RepID=UPI001CFAC2D5|nr:cytochrome P450 2J5-like [Protopterus annectens]
MLHFWVAIIVLLVTFFFWKWKRPRQFPPGPWAVPIIGNFLQLNYRNPIPDYEKLGKQFGNVYSVYLGNNAVVIFRGYQMVKEALVNHATEFADRPSDPIFHAISKNKGILFAYYGKSWKEKRRLSLRMMKNLGMGKISMESTILEESKYLLKSFEDMSGQSFEPKSTLREAASNIICCILFGNRFDYSFAMFANLIERIDKATKLIGGFWGEVYNGVPFIRCLPLPHRDIFKTISMVHNFLRIIIMDHKKTLKVGEPRDFIDLCIEDINKKQNDFPFDDESMLFVLTELFLAGSDTTANTLEWALLLMMVYPEIQGKMEIQ